MIGPNLSSKPFLNTRPIWLVSCAAGFLAVVLIVLIVVFYVSSSRTLAPQIEQREGLQAQHDALVEEVQLHVAALEDVPWRSLAARVRSTNVILHEHGFSWIKLLDDIERVMPYDVRIVQIAPTVGSNQVNLNLTLVTKNREAMFEFLENLIADPSFARPVPIIEKWPEESEAIGYLLGMKVDYQPTEVAS